MEALAKGLKTLMKLQLLTKYHELASTYRKCERFIAMRYFSGHHYTIVAFFRFSRVTNT
ncbi:hypothetical protein [Rhizobium esperanzae]|uniref:hypothetical protein n=1 Tax=Rhizobium esperanzae TaxID=1967781 RepID=UPI001595B45B|nr:hypothetical protein [Rhizobium esperanzae]